MNAVGLMLLIQHLAGTAGPTANSPTLCTPEETPLFSCSVEKSQKLAAVCRSGDRLTYRFGKPAAIELAFPATPGPAKDNFQFDQAGVAGARTSRLSFDNGGVTYTIQETTSGSESSASIVIDAPHSLNLGFLEKTLSCKKGYRLETSELLKLLPPS